MKNSIIAILILLGSLIHPAAQAQQRIESIKFKPIADSVQKYIRPYASIGGNISIESAIISQQKEIRITFSTLLSDYPLRDFHIEEIYSITEKLMPDEYKDFKIKLLCNRSPIEDLASEYYTKENLEKIEQKQNRERIAPAKNPKTTKLVTNLSQPFDIDNGLQNNHIALWQSHGYYYNQNELRWMWQRATIFETVEDLYTQSYVLPFLVPMLENAGANVLLPRERDFRKEEVIIDGEGSKFRSNDVNCTLANGNYRERNGKSSWKKSPLVGFADTQEFYLTGENPFTMGSANMTTQIFKSENDIRKILENDTDMAHTTLPEDISYADWIPSVPVSGEYAVYVSYQTLDNSTENALYRVFHKGGVTDFSINQKMGGSTWIYLGHFAFEKDSDSQGVRLYNLTSNNKKQEVVVADAVKFGGGMGNIARKPADEGSIENLKSSASATKPVIKKLPFDVDPETSKYPRFTEGSRYWLQWAGFADSVYTPNRDMNDYNDDYQSRAYWVNALAAGSVRNPSAKGYNIPIDLSFAFHTDAGTTLNDSIIGTLMIYTRFSDNKDKFPNGEPRITSRQYGDIVQTQIVEDIRALYNEDWSRRGLWDRSYFESRKPEVPAVLLELLSHQNLADLRFGLDPKFRFHVSRAIYKGMLRYLSFKEGFDYIVQPLPPESFSAEISSTGGKYPQITLNWDGVSDPLEPTADPEGYIVYIRKYDPASGDEFAAFDNGKHVTGNSLTLPVEKGYIYSFKVAAVNKGGVSFPSEILSVGVSDKIDAPVAMIVNGFTRVSAPSSFASRDSSRAGFSDFIDFGVPYLYDISHIGSQYEFRRSIPWMTDNAPGFGASRRDYETDMIAGNTFDYPFVHGISIMKHGYSFVSSGVSAVENGRIDLCHYDLVDMIMGKQIKTPKGHFNDMVDFEVYSHKLQKALSHYCKEGGNLVISGSYIATDLWDSLFEPPVTQSQRDGITQMIRTNTSSYRQLNTIITNLRESADNYSETIDNNWITEKDSILLSDLNEKLLSVQKIIDSLQGCLRSLDKDINQFENSIDPALRTKDFATGTLKYTWVTQLASATGLVKPAQNPYGFKGNYSFNTKPNGRVYSVESPDGVKPVGDDAWTIYRYYENNISAGVAYNGDYKSVILGFPIETLQTREQIDNIFGEIIEFFQNN